MKRQLCTLALGLLCLTFGACVTSSNPGIQMPMTYERKGVQVETTGLLRVATRMEAVSGRVTNNSGRPVKWCKLSYQALDYQGLEVARASVSKDGLAPGEVWEFEARFNRSHVPDFRTVMRGPMQLEFAD